jgi:hypothetical protein
MPFNTFGELPLVLMAQATSPFLPRAWICFEKMSSKQQSLPMLVRIDVSVVRAMAARGGAFDSETVDEFGRNMLGVGRTTAVSENEHLALGGQTFGQALGAGFEFVQVFLYGAVFDRQTFGQDGEDTVFHGQEAVSKSRL